MDVLVLGASGMLGHAVYRAFLRLPHCTVWGTVRSASKLGRLPELTSPQTLVGVDVLDNDALESALERAKPQVVINCIGLIKQRPEAQDSLAAIQINALLPHRVASLCARFNARLVHISTDCVFSGAKGLYTEDDTADATDLYGRSKLLGEVTGLPNALTLRTSLIGHELEGGHSLVDWFLAQEGRVPGYAHAIFSGLPTVEFARVLCDVVIPRPQLTGLYHVSSTPIDKLTLLEMVARRYSKDIAIVPDDMVRINRSLNSSRFQRATDYRAPTWDELVDLMYLQYQSYHT